MTRILPALGLLVLVSGPALADPAAAGTCAATLSPGAQAIYAAAAPQVTPTTDLKSLLTTTTKGLVKSGKVSMGSARSSAESAAACLKLLK